MLVIPVGAHRKSSDEANDKADDEEHLCLGDLGDR